MWIKLCKFDRIKLKPNQELTIYLFLSRLNKEYGSSKDIGKCRYGPGLDIKLRGSHHLKAVDVPNSAKCYIFYIFRYEYEGRNCKKFRKEYPHPRYCKHTIKEEDLFPNWIGKTMGFKVATINTDDDGVEFWSWFDKSGNIQDDDMVETLTPTSGFSFG